MQIGLNGLVTGFGIALLALAFQSVYLPTRVFFIGLSGLYALTPYVYLMAHAAGVPRLASVAVAVAVIVGLAAALEWLNHAPLMRRGASDGIQFISSLATYIVLIQMIVMIWGNNAQTMRTGREVTTHLGDVVLTQSQLITASVACALFIAFLTTLSATDIGRRLRALADNRTQFALFGYSVHAHRLTAFGLSGLFAAVASLAAAYEIGFDPHGGLHAVLLAVVAVTIGGRSFFVGPVAGGVLLGLLRAGVLWYLSGRWQDPVTFAVLAMFLLLRPHGLFGRKPRLEATA